MLFVFCLCERINEDFFRFLIDLSIKPTNRHRVNIAITSTTCLRNGRESDNRIGPLPYRFLDA